MPSRSVVTRENLSRDFVIQAGLPGGGCLRLNLSTQFTRDPETGLISVTVGGVAISEDAGNIIEMRGDGLFATAGAAAVAISANAGNIVTLEEDGLFVPPPPAAPAQRPVGPGDTSVAVVDGAGDPAPYEVAVRRSADVGNQIELRDDGLFVPEGGGGGGGGAFGVIVHDLVEIVVPGDEVHTILASENMNYLVFRGMMGQAILSPQASVAYPADFEVVIIRDEPGSTFAITAGIGVILNGEDEGEVRCGPMSGGIRLKRVAADRWVAHGLATDEFNSAIRITSGGVQVKIAQIPGNTVTIRPGTGMDSGLFSGPPEVMIQNVEIPSRVIEAYDAGKIIELGPVTDASLSEFESYVPLSEYTLVRAGGAFTITIGAGFTVNGLSGPQTYNVTALPGGAVLKVREDGEWLLMGDATLVAP